jgi:hypothetical protein
MQEWSTKQLVLVHHIRQHAKWLVLRSTSIHLFNPRHLIHPVVLQRWSAQKRTTSKMSWWWISTCCSSILFRWIIELTIEEKPFSGYPHDWEMFLDSPNIHAYVINCSMFYSRTVNKHRMLPYPSPINTVSSNSTPILSSLTFDKPTPLMSIGKFHISPDVFVVVDHTIFRNRIWLWFKW